jgi:uncharacterized Zn finger protein
MDVNVTQGLVNFDGSEISFGGTQCSECGHVREAMPLTVRRVAVDALLSNTNEDAGLSGTERLKRFVLARKLTDQDDLELTSEEVSMIIGMLPRRWGTLVYGAMVTILDPAMLQQANG